MVSLKHFAISHIGSCFSLIPFTIFKRGSHEKINYFCLKSCYRCSWIKKKINSKAVKILSKPTSRLARRLHFFGCSLCDVTAWTFIESLMEKAYLFTSCSVSTVGWLKTPRTFLDEPRVSPWQTLYNGFVLLNPYQFLSIKYSVLKSPLPKCLYCSPNV